MDDKACSVRSRSCDTLVRNGYFISDLEKSFALSDQIKPHLYYIETLGNFEDPDAPATKDIHGCQFP